ncbi:MAG: hypothetical protein MK097_11640 [Dechloromonas sp.]|nr:hypothetical protein [Dechloromonas sp.]
MYDFLDRPVTSLDHGGRFLVWSMRNWVKAVSEKACPASTIAGAFRKWDMLPGLQPFLRMMALFNRYGLENFQFCALACNHVSEHEAIIISLIVSMREIRPEAVRKTIGLLVEEDGIGELISALASLCKAMDAAAIYPGWPAEQHSPAPQRPL